MTTANTKWDHPLTPNEEIRLSTAANFITLALFRPLDNFGPICRKSREQGKLKVFSLFAGWPLQALNKAVDDEIFNANIRRVTSFCEEKMGIKNPGGTPYGRAAVGTCARALTLGVMLPYNSLQDVGKRREFRQIQKESVEFNRIVPFAPLYRGFQRSLLKESVFTASYVLGSAYFGNLYSRHRDCVSATITKLCPKVAEDEDKKQQYTNVAVASLRAASAGVISTLLTQPIDNAGKGIPASRQLSKACRKAVRKGCYNGINTVILQTLVTTKVHRKLLVLAQASKPKLTEATNAK